ncbi:MAG: DegT/DnrJ/EryC1/StrS family aminotransferase [Candidatus Eisenbacteria bacterium]|uniref:DegT/DnrJ/EryC1/StrS family aminotransferase n=1 Tax=Eiseniibacteriota bacterium TaxID=2212470 RepID=A0A937XAN6_UNCEI|nr:DegT/DnrJ/EryC1/StrS family aminotransferase [Candidatus Eisenbacteria bacterium]
MTDDTSRPDEPAGDPPLSVYDVRAHDRTLAPRIAAAVERVIASGWFVLGSEGERFEAAWAEWLGGGEVVGVGSGTDALRLALTAGGVGPGDGVLTVPNTAVPTASAISAAGAEPHFVDVDPATGLIAIEKVEAALRPNTRAILPVHLHGRAAPMEPLVEIARRRGLLLVEDAAQAHGALTGGRPAGTWGDFGCFSFYPSKNLGAYGDGGAIWTSSPEAAAALRRLRNYGQSDRYVHDSIGLNSRLDEIQAAILGVKLPHLRAWNRRRAELARRYRALLRSLPLALPAEAPEGAHVFHLFAVRVSDREAVRARLSARGIATQVHYPIPIHLQRAYRHLGGRPGDFPAAEAWCAETLSLPFSPALAEADLARVAGALAEALAETQAGTPAETQAEAPADPRGDARRETRSRTRNRTRSGAPGGVHPGTETPAGRAEHPAPGRGDGLAPETEAS